MTERMTDERFNELWNQWFVRCDHEHQHAQQIRELLQALKAERVERNSYAEVAELATAKIERLEATLERVRAYTQHKPSCHYWRFNNTDKCSCGLDELEAALNAEKAPG